ncbi:MAG: hypothetical protein WA421_04675 [Nitrososphaeraceae archaeon]
MYVIFIIPTDEQKQYISVFIFIAASVITTYQKGNRRRTYTITDKGLRLLHLRDHHGELLLTTTSPSPSSPKTIIMR